MRGASPESWMSGLPAPFSIYFSTLEKSNTVVLFKKWIKTLAASEESLQIPSLHSWDKVIQDHAMTATEHRYFRFTKGDQEVYAVSNSGIKVAGRRAPSELTFNEAAYCIMEKTRVTGRL
eukprot:TRINITY_DN6345_c0_g2_i1.p1 TRINITY_DN6345_c0_g2~~TRINITY_DN6345_c0_g2_i1.p1  ORF type:complete len:120 (+),score=2.82 TRINITY_DN6345_c0_g2_i1:122-481(+)